MYSSAAGWLMTTVDADPLMVSQVQVAAPQRPSGHARTSQLFSKTGAVPARTATRRLALHA